MGDSTYKVFQFKNTDHSSQRESPLVDIHLVVTPDPFRVAHN